MVVPGTASWQDCAARVCRKFLGQRTKTPNVQPKSSDPGLLPLESELSRVQLAQKLAAHGHDHCWLRGAETGTLTGKGPRREADNRGTGSRLWSRPLLRNKMPRRTGHKMIAGLIVLACQLGLFAGCSRDPNNIGVLETVWGRRGLSDGRLRKPRAMAIDAQDQLYIVDMTAPRHQRRGLDAPARQTGLHGPPGDRCPQLLYLRSRICPGTVGGRHDASEQPGHHVYACPRQGAGAADRKSPAPGAI